jgi:hypothetical protein
MNPYLPLDTYFNHVSDGQRLVEGDNPDENRWGYTYIIEGDFRKVQPPEIKVEHRPREILQSLDDAVFEAKHKQLQAREAARQVRQEERQHRWLVDEVFRVTWPVIKQATSWSPNKYREHLADTSDARLEMQLEWHREQERKQKERNRKRLKRCPVCGTKLERETKNKTERLYCWKCRAYEDNPDKMPA